MFGARSTWEWMLVALLMGGCSGTDPARATGEAATSGGVSGSLPVGSTLVTTGNLNLRSGPSTSNGILEVMPKGAHVTTVAAKPSGRFYDVSYDGTTGWASGAYLALVKTAPDDAGTDGGDDAGPDASTADAPTSVWTPAPGTTWQWQLQDTVDTTVDAQVYDIDLFDTDSSVVDKLHALGRKVICYVSVGSWENFRPDASQFPASVLGNTYSGYPDEKWLDIRQIDQLAPVMRARFDMCKAKGFDALEPDNIDGYTNGTGFPLTAADQIAYNKWLANEAHQRGLSIGLKNDADQVGDLLSSFDWALTEDCDAQSWCSQVAPFISASKAVFMCEYTDTGAATSSFCPRAAAQGLSGILKDRSLNAWRQACP